MTDFRHRSVGGFTLVEIMVVIGVIAILVTIALPNFIRARKRSEAGRILEDLRVIDHATDTYAIDTGKTAGFNPGFADLKNYIKSDTVLYSTGADLFGNTYGPFTVDSTPVVSSAAFDALSDVADASFWSPY